MPLVCCLRLKAIQHSLVLQQALTLGLMLIVKRAAGNEWSITTKYSAAAIIIKIKSFDKRFS